MSPSRRRPFASYQKLPPPTVFPPPLHFLIPLNFLTFPRSLILILNTRTKVCEYTNIRIYANIRVMPPPPPMKAPLGGQP